MSAETGWSRSVKPIFGDHQQFSQWPKYGCPWIWKDIVGPESKRRYTPGDKAFGNLLFCWAINNIEKAHPTEDKVENGDQTSPEAYREEHRPNITSTPIQPEPSLDHPGWTNPMGMRNKINIVRDRDRRRTSPKRKGKLSLSSMWMMWMLWNCWN